ncbi:hypothetical protein Tco_0151333 [Tanacetum coccineum]
MYVCPFLREWAPLFILLESYPATQEWQLSSRISEAVAGLMFGVDAHVVKLQDMLEGVLVLSGLSRVWKSQTRDLILRDSSGNDTEGGGRLPFYYAPPAAADVAISDPTPVDLATGTPSAKVIANAEASKKRKASTSGLALSHVAKRTSHQDSRGKAIMSDAAAAPSGDASRSQAFNAPIHSFRYLTDDAIHMDFFPFTPGPYYATYSEDDVVAGSYEVSREEWDGPHHPTLTILTKEIFKDLSICKTVVDHFPTPQEMSFWPSIEVTDLNDKVSSSDAAFVKDKAKGKDRKKKIKSLSKSLDQLTAEVSYLSSDLNQSRNVVAQKDDEKFLASDEFSRVQGELLSLTANAGFERGLHMDRTQEQFDAALKKISCFVPGAQSRLACPVVVPTPKAVGVSPPIPKELTVTPAPSLVELFLSDAPPSSVAALEQNEEWLNAMVDTTDESIVDVASEKPGEVFVQGMAHPINDDASRAKSSLIRGSKSASFSSSDVVVALSFRGK